MIGTRWRKRVACARGGRTGERPDKQHQHPDAEQKRCSQSDGPLKPRHGPLVKAVVRGLQKDGRPIHYASESSPAQ